MLRYRRGICIGLEAGEIANARWWHGHVRFAGSGPQTESELKTMELGPKARVLDNCNANGNGVAF